MAGNMGERRITHTQPGDFGQDKAQQDEDRGSRPELLRSERTGGSVCVVGCWARMHAGGADGFEGDDAGWLGCVEGIHSPL